MQCEKYMQPIILFGGSFNPPHTGHFELAKYVADILDLNEVWFLLSDNPQKDPQTYAHFDLRLKMTQLMVDYYPDYRFFVSDYQREKGTFITYQVIQHLQQEHPNQPFIWLMGADSFISLHTWHNWKYIMNNIMITVLKRPGFEQAIKACEAYKQYQHIQINLAELAQQYRHKNGWVILDNPMIDTSSTEIRTAIENGQTQFNCQFQPIFEHVIKPYHLYKKNNIR